MSIAPLKAVDLSGQSPDNVTYIQQLFAIQAGKPYTGTWPSEATDEGERVQTIVQQVAALVGAGPYYTLEPLLTCQQVEWANEMAGELPALNLNPVYERALERAAEVASRHKGALPWASKSQPVRVVNPGGSYGDTPVSGYYGTGHGTLR